MPKNGAALPFFIEKFVKMHKNQEENFLASIIRRYGRHTSYVILSFQTRALHKQKKCNLMKRFLSLALCAVMLMALALVAFADEPADVTPHDSVNGTGGSQPGVEPQATCDHTYTSETVHEPFSYRDNKTCESKSYEKLRCVKCGRKHSIYLGSVIVDHSGTIYDATCNGVEQNLYFRDCVHCGEKYYLNRPCPAAPHQGGCNRLPLAVTPPLVTE